MKIAAKFKYKNGEGIAVGVCKKAPKEALERADVIALMICKNKRGTKGYSEVNYFTPDEAMCVAIGLLRGIDLVMHKKFNEFRKEAK